MRAASHVFVAYEFLGGVFLWFVWRVLCCRGGLCICLSSSLVYIVIPEDDDASRICI